jgi:hypothetical protein
MSVVGSNLLLWDLTGRSRGARLEILQVICVISVVS